MPNEGDTLLVNVEKTDKFDKFDSSTFAVDGPEFRSIESSRYQVLHRTTANEPLKKVQQTKGQQGSEARHAIVWIYDQRNTSGKKVSICSSTGSLAPASWLRAPFLHLFLIAPNLVSNFFVPLMNVFRMSSCCSTSLDLSRSEMLLVSAADSEERRCCTANFSLHHHR